MLLLLPAWQEQPKTPDYPSRQYMAAFCYNRNMSESLTNKQEQPKDDQKIGKAGAALYELLFSPDEIHREAENIKTIERQFSERLDKIATEGKRMSDKELKIWESELASAWGRIDSKIQSNEELSYDITKQADKEFPVFSYAPTKDGYDKAVHQTIEAQVGRFFHERERALRDAIESSDSDKKEKDLEAITEFTKLVDKHIQMKEETDAHWETGGDDWESFDRQRTRVHNDTIRALNRLNALSKQYGATPFTPRDFWPSDKLSNSDKKDLATIRRARYDRDIVEEYYAIAFESKVKEAEERLIDRNPQMLEDEKTKRDYFLHRDHFKGDWDEFWSDDKIA